MVYGVKADVLCEPKVIRSRTAQHTQNVKHVKSQLRNVVWSFCDRWVTSKGPILLEGAISKTEYYVTGNATRKTYFIVRSSSIWNKMMSWCTAKNTCTHSFKSRMVKETLLQGCIGCLEHLKNMACYLSSVVDTFLYTVILKRKLYITINYTVVFLQLVKGREQQGNMSA